MLVRQPDTSVFIWPESYVLIDLRDLIVVRVRDAVSSDKTVDQSHSRIGMISEVPSVSPILIFMQAQVSARVVTVFQRRTVDLLRYAMVIPFPYGRSGDVVTLFDYVPVFLKIAQRITHRMDIFPHHERLVGDFLSHFQHPLRREVAVIIYFRNRTV